MIRCLFPLNFAFTDLLKTLNLEEYYYVKSLRANFLILANFEPHNAHVIYLSLPSNLMIKN